MKRVVITDIEENVHLDSVNYDVPIFAKHGDRLQGMLVYEETRGWILRIGGDNNVTGHYKTRKECIESCIRYNYTFYIV